MSSLCITSPIERPGCNPAPPPRVASDAGTARLVPVYGTQRAERQDGGKARLDQHVIIMWWLAAHAHGHSPDLTLPQSRGACGRQARQEGILEMEGRMMLRVWEGRR